MQGLRIYKVAFPAAIRHERAITPLFFFFYSYELSEPPWQMYNKTLFHTDRTLRKSRVTRSHMSTTD